MDNEYFIAFYTTDCPEGSIDCVRVRLDMVRQTDMSKPMAINLSEDPLYKELSQYVKTNS